MVAGTRPKLGPENTLGLGQDFFRESRSRRRRVGSSSSSEISLRQGPADTPPDTPDAGLGVLLCARAGAQGQPLPAPSAELHFIVVDPGVAGRWRIATAADVAALERSTTTWPPSP